MEAGLIALATIAACLLGLLAWKMTTDQRTTSQTTSTLAKTMEAQAEIFRSNLISITSQMTEVFRATMTESRASFDQTFRDQNTLLTKVMVPADQDLMPTPLPDLPPDDSLSFRQELEMAPPHLRAQMIREEMETRLTQTRTAPIRDLDPRVPIVDPNADPREAVIWSPPTSEANGPEPMHISRMMVGDLDALDGRGS